MTFGVTSVVGLIVGFALIGSVTYLPVFLQIVKGLSPTESGLRMVPLMTGTLVTSILSGQLVSRTGKYKLFPIIGTTIVSISLLLISRMTADTSTLVASLYMLLLGLGLGFVMQVLIIAVQNAVDYRELGVNFECDLVSLHRRLAGHCAAWRRTGNATTHQRAAAYAWHGRTRFDQPPGTRRA